MARFQVFLSVVYVVRDQSARLAALLSDASEQLGDLASDYELIVIDNASSDDSLAVLKQVTGTEGLPNIQVFALTEEVDFDTAAWAGLQNALGEYIAVIDPMDDDIAFLPSMLAKAVEGHDLVFANNVAKQGQGLWYRAASALFSSLYRSIHGVHLATDAPAYRLVSRRVVNFLLQHSQPTVTYRHLAATGGFLRTTLQYSGAVLGQSRKSLGQGIERGMRLLISTTRAPLRAFTWLSLFGAGINLVYSVYVLLVAAMKTDVAPGWTSLSLQQSGMFFLLSVLLLVLGEYVLYLVSITNERPSFFIGQEMTSARMSRRDKLNVELGAAPGESRRPAQAMERS